MRTLVTLLPPTTTVRQKETEQKETDQSPILIGSLLIHQKKTGKDIPSFGIV